MIKPLLAWLALCSPVIAFPVAAWLVCGARKGRR